MDDPVTMKWWKQKQTKLKVRQTWISPGLLSQIYRQSVVFVPMILHTTQNFLHKKWSDLCIPASKSVFRFIALHFNKSIHNLRQIFDSFVFQVNIDVFDIFVISRRHDQSGWPFEFAAKMLPNIRHAFYIDFWDVLKCFLVFSQFRTWFLRP